MLCASHLELKPERTEPHLDKLDFRRGIGQEHRGGRPRRRVTPNAHSSGSDLSDT